MRDLFSGSRAEAVRKTGFGPDFQMHTDLSEDWHKAAFLLVFWTDRCTLPNLPRRLGR